MIEGKITTNTIIGKCGILKANGRKCVVKRK